MFGLRLRGGHNSILCASVHQSIRHKDTKAYDEVATTRPYPLTRWFVSGFIESMWRWWTRTVPAKSVAKEGTKIRRSIDETSRQDDKSNG